MPIITTNKKNVETVQYGAVMGHFIKSIFGYEPIPYNTLKVIDDDDDIELEVQTIMFKNDYMVLVWFDGIKVLDEKYMKGSSSHMFLVLGELEDYINERDEEYAMETLTNYVREKKQKRQEVEEVALEDMTEEMLAPLRRLEMREEQ